MKNLQEYICEAIDFKTRINKEGLKPQANEESFNTFAKQLTDHLNQEYHLDEQFEVNDILEAIKLLNKCFYPLQLDDFGLNPKNGLLSFCKMWNCDGKEGLYEYTKNDGWTLLSSFATD